MSSVIVANIWYGIAFFAIMLLAALQSVPSELYEAGSMDGANGTRKLFNVTLPYIMPTVITTTLLRAIWIFNDPSIIYGLTNGGPAGLDAYLVLAHAGQDHVRRRLRGGFGDRHRHDRHPAAVYDLLFNRDQDQRNWGTSK